MYHQTSPSLRGLLYQLANVLKLSFDNKVNSSCCQAEINITEAANSKLSQFEKTYVSFPEFVDPNTTNEPGDRINMYTTSNLNSSHNTRPWHQNKALTSC